MKKSTGLGSVVILMAIFTFTISLISCQKEKSLSKDGTNLSTASNNSASTKISGAPTKVNSMSLYNKVVDANGMKPMSNATLLFDAVGHMPVSAPDGHQVSLKEFNMASGWADVKCINMGTHVTVHLMGLIPNGIYTIWTVPMKDPGYNGTLDNTIGVGALGAGDGSQNAFTASADGTASLSVTVPAESLSIFGAVGGCFGSEFEVLLATAYHMDGLTHGPTPGDEATWVFQSGFPIFGSQL